MKKLLNALSLAVICAGSAIVSRPAPASATYLNPWTGGGTGSGSGIVYCCETNPTASCCYATGCQTRAGMCSLYTG